jgi:hypothetical protein
MYGERISAYEYRALGENVRERTTRNTRSI